MSVTIHGVKGYEYQYKVTVLIALVSKADKINFFVESGGSEDALIIIEKNGIQQEIEIQVKRENNLIDIPKITEWLSHFEERKSDKNLLQKIKTNDQSTAVFITHSRCSDDTVKLKTSLNNINNHKSIPISKDWFKKFQEALKNQKFGKTALMRKRKIFCQDQSSTLSTKTELQSILKKCLILEEFTDEKVDDYIYSILNTEFNVAQSRVHTVYLELLEKVKEGRDASGDVYQTIMDCIQSNQIGSPTIDNNYLTRKEESRLFDVLKNKGVLLLTGISQCGKTEIAKTISNRFISQGYDYQIHDSIPALKRFLRSNTSDNKIAILEDPFGHISLKEDHIDIVQRLKETLSNRESHHHIIISSRLEIILDLFDTNNIKDCSINSKDWINLTINDNEIINSYWIEIAKEKLFPPKIIDTVSKGILASNSDGLLQIGQLTYLVNEEIKSLKGKNFSEIEHIARRDSREIANNLKKWNKLSADILSYISICSNPIHEVLRLDLNYILSDCDDFFSIRDKRIFSTSFADKTHPTFPKYAVDLKINQDTLDALNYLEERGFINVNEESILITHPNYYEAGRHLFIEKGFLKQKEKLEVYKKCIACLNTSTAFYASKNFDFILERISKDCKNEILNIAFLGINSIFPAVEDNSSIFLMKYILEISEENYPDLITKIQNGGTDSSYIYWHNNNTPFISHQGGFSWHFSDIDALVLQKVEKQLSDKILPDLNNAWSYLQALDKEKDLSIEKFSLLLQYNEAFIRKEVVFKIFKRPNVINKSIILDLFRDEHPNVIFSIIRASLLNWFSLPKDIKALIFEQTCSSLHKEQVAIRAFNLISNFSIDYGHESIFQRDFKEMQKKELYLMWGKFFPICAKSIPLGVSINTPRFGSTMDSALEYLDLKTGIIVLSSWYNRIEYQIQNDKYLDDYELSIARSLMDFTKNNYKIRKEIFSKLVNYKDTNFLLSSLKWIVPFWDNLHKTEIDQIVQLVKSDREDLRWIKAVILNVTNSSTPKELVPYTLDFNKLNGDFSQIYYSFADQLLRDCLNVFCGFPQPLWWIAVHHHNQDFWENLIRYIFENDNNIGFDICLQEFLSHGVNGFGNNWNDWEDVWSKLCANSTDLNSLAKVLSYNVANCTCNCRTVNILWTKLIESYSSINKEKEIIKFVSDHIELIQQTGHKQDLFEFFSGEFLTEVIKLLKLDYFIYNLLKQSKIEQEKKLDVLIELSKTHDIRFFSTFNYMKNAEISDNLKSTLESLSNLIDVKGKAEFDKLNEIEEYKLDNWIGLN